MCVYILYNVHVLVYLTCIFSFREGFERLKFELRNLTAELQYNERQLQPKVHFTCNIVAVGIQCTCTVHTCTLSLHYYLRLHLLLISNLYKHMIASCN